MTLSDITHNHLRELRSQVIRDCTGQPFAPVGAEAVFLFDAVVDHLPFADDPDEGRQLDHLDGLRRGAWAAGELLDIVQFVAGDALTGWRVDDPAQNEAQATFQATLYFGLQIAAAISRIEARFPQLAGVPSSTTVH